jgi:RNA polymerase sigma factor (sigma-70 family)
MKATWLRTALGRLSWPTDGPTEGDGSLLARYAATRDEGAFALLVQRHGAMVRGVCLRILNNSADADDAFQATFLVLARRASRLGSGSVRNWLWGVAYRVACRARATSARRRHHEERAGRPQAEAVLYPEEDPEWTEVRLLLDAELARLPARYRLPLLLCYLEGRSRTEVARELGWPEGSVAGRLARARDLLRRRLSARGWTLPATVPLAWAVLPGDAARAAVAVVSEQALPPTVVSLGEGALLAMRITRLKVLALSVTAALCLGALVWAQSFTAPTAGRILPQPQEDANRQQPKNREEKVTHTENPDNAESNTVDDKVAEADRILDLLDSQVNYAGLNDPKATLDDALKQLKLRYGMKYQINVRAFQNEKIDNVDDLTIADKQDIPPIQDTLLVVLKQILANVRVRSGATFHMRGGILEITTVAAVQAEVWGPEFDGPFLPLVNLRAKKMPLNKALDLLAEHSQISIVYLGEADKETRPVTARLTNVPVDTAVRGLAAQVGLTVVHRDNVLFVTTPAQAATMTKEFQAETPDPADPARYRKWRRSTYQTLPLHIPTKKDGS